MIGAGLMGAGIAYVTAQAGIDVVLIDRDQEAADKGKAYSANIMAGQIKRGRAKQADADALLARITPTPDYEQLKGADLIIEAVFEDRKVKAEATAKAQAVVGDKVVFGSNTSTLPITSLAETSKDPKNFIGVHFFSPVEKMMLVEIIMGEKTARSGARGRARLCARDPQDADRGERLARLLHLARGRDLHPRRPPDVDRRRAGRDDRECRPQAGMPVGPLSLNDEVAVDLAWKILKATEADLGAAGDRSRGRRRCSRRWWRSAAASGARTPRASTTIRRAARSGCGRALPNCSGTKLDPDTIDK